MAALFLGFLLQNFIQDSRNDFKTRLWVFKHYGSFGRAFYTLFEVTLAGCWPNYFRPLVEDVSVWYGAFAIFYVSMVVFAVIRIITAIFLKDTLAVASSDTEMIVMEQTKKKQMLLSKLEQAFKAIDMSGDGKLSKDEFLAFIAHSGMRSWLQTMELPVDDASALFGMLADSSGEVSYDDFLKGVIRLKGQARSMDVVRILFATDRILANIDHIQGLLDHSTPGVNGSHKTCQNGNSSPDPTSVTDSSAGRTKVLRELTSSLTMARLNSDC